MKAQTLQKILPASALLISILIHLCIFVAISGIIVIVAYAPPQAFESDNIQPSSGPTDQPPEAIPEQQPDPMATTPDTPPDPTPQTQVANVNTDVITSSNPSQEFQIAAPPIGAIATNNPEKSSSANIIRKISLAPTMSARSGEQRAEAMSRSGGKEASEQAVLNALRWLQKVQNPNGTWGERWPGAMTGLATLCYLGHGETPMTSREFGSTVEKAINALLDAGAKNEGNMTLRGKDFGDNESTYEHAIATYALCEAYTMTKDERLAPVVTKAVGYILKGQGPDGGWVYRYTKAVPSDTSVSGWQIQALKAAKLTGLPIDGIPDALDKAMKNLDRVYNPKTGAYGYHVPTDRAYSLTGVGVLCKVFWQENIDGSIRQSIKEIMAGPPVKYDLPTCNLYAWYYHTQACFMVGGGAWAKWNRMFQDEIDRSQDADGSWPPNPKSKEGLTTADTVDGSLYRTCLCTLMLEVYYRYLPTGKLSGEVKEDPE
ncbi:MAG: terpene cyclase/mutase family protein [Methylacidiphilales bacterium]|nr:terpene cyclase/mutase family protein [Candidatus Methylacidiphilales bacterium]